MTSYLGNALPNSLVTATDLFGAATVVANAMTSSSNSSSTSSSSNSSNNQISSDSSQQSNNQHNRVSIPNQHQQLNNQVPIQSLSYDIKLPITSDTTNQHLLNIQDVNYIIK